jgi:hypothetical protein
LDHYPEERNHQGFDNGLIKKPYGVPDGSNAVESKERLGGILMNYYHQAA